MKEASENTYDNTLVAERGDKFNYGDDFDGTGTTVVEQTFYQDFSMTNEQEEYNNTNSNNKTNQTTNTLYHSAYEEVSFYVNDNNSTILNNDSAMSPLPFSPIASTDENGRSIQYPTTNNNSSNNNPKPFFVRRDSSFDGIVTSPAANHHQHHHRDNTMTSFASSSIYADDEREEQGIGTSDYEWTEDEGNYSNITTSNNNNYTNHYSTNNNVLPPLPSSALSNTESSTYSSGGTNESDNDNNNANSEDVALNNGHPVESQIPPEEQQMQALLSTEDNDEIGDFQIISPSETIGDVISASENDGDVEEEADVASSSTIITKNNAAQGNVVSPFSLLGEALEPTLSKDVGSENNDEAWEIISQVSGPSNERTASVENTIELKTSGDKAGTENADDDAKPAASVNFTNDQPSQEKNHDDTVSLRSKMTLDSMSYSASSVGQQQSSSSVAVSLLNKPTISSTDLAVVPPSGPPSSGSSSRALTLFNNPRKFVFLSDEKAVPKQLNKLQEHSMRQRHVFQTKVHTLECKLASMTARLAVESMDTDVELKSIKDDVVFKPIEQAYQRLSLDQSRSCIGATRWINLEKRVSLLDSQMTHSIFVGYQDSKKSTIDTLRDEIDNELKVDLQVESIKADKREAVIVRQFEELVGSMVRRYQEERASRLAAIQIMQEDLQQSLQAKDAITKYETILQTLQRLRQQLAIEKKQRQDHDAQIMDQIHRKHDMMEKAILEAFGDPNI